MGSGGGIVVVVEDDEATGALIALQTRRLDLTTKIFRDSRDAFSFVAEPEGRSDILLFILDYQLAGGQNGLSFYRDCIAHGISGPAILTTGFSDQGVIIEALRCGVRDVVLKSADFSETLKLTISQVLGDHARQSELRALRADREAQERVQKAFSAAEVVAWSYGTGSNLISCEGHSLMSILGDIGGDSSGSIPLEDFLKLLTFSERRSLFNSVLGAAKKSGYFEFHLRLQCGDKMCCWLVRGEAVTTSVRDTFSASGIAIDITEKQEALSSLQTSLKEISLLNDRLGRSMAETHHRIKNSFQIVSSLLSIEGRKTGDLSRDSLKTIQGHVRALASLHDLLTDRAQEGKDVEFVPIDELAHQVSAILRSLSARLQTEVDHISGVMSARSASALMVVMVELVMNANKYCRTHVILTISQVGELVTIAVVNDIPIEPIGEASLTGDRTSNSSRGLVLVQRLLSNDLNASLEEQTTESIHSASFSVSVRSLNA